MIGILDDSHLENNERFNITLTLAGNNDPSIRVDPALATVTIIDNDSELYSIMNQCCIYLSVAREFYGSKHVGWSTGITIGFNQTLYEVSENESFALIFVVIIRGTLQREVVVDVSTQDDTALGIAQINGTLL